MNWLITISKGINKYLITNPVYDDGIIRLFNSGLCIDDSDFRWRICVIVFGKPSYRILMYDQRKQMMDDMYDLILYLLFRCSVSSPKPNLIPEYSLYQRKTK